MKSRCKGKYHTLHDILCGLPSVIWIGSNKFHCGTFSATQYQTSAKTAQIFELDCLQEQLGVAHLCPGAHFVFVADGNTPQGLYHENGLRCSLCEKISPLTNFKRKSNKEVQEPNQRLYLENALTGIHREVFQIRNPKIDVLLILGVGHDNISLIMTILCLKIPNKTNFVPQVLQT